MNKQLGTVAWPSRCVELTNISHPPVLAGTQQARCSAPCPPRRPASAPFPAAAGSPTTSPCVALPPPLPSDSCVCTRPCVPSSRAVAHTALFSSHPLHTCPVSLHPGTPALPCPRSSHASHVSLTCWYSRYSGARCAHLPCAIQCPLHTYSASHLLLFSSSSFWF